MAFDGSRPEARSRRAVLTAALAGLAGLIGARFARPDPVGAVHLPGFGHANAAGAANTTLTTSSAGTALLVTQNGTGTALRGSAVGAGSIAGFFTANNGTGVSGVTGASGTYGVFAANNGAAGGGGALRASGGNNDGVVASANALGGFALKGNAPNGVGVGGYGIDGVNGTGIQKGVSGASLDIGVWGDGLGDGSYGGRFQADGPTGAGVWSYSINGTGVGAVGGDVGLYASGLNKAAVLDGDVDVNGTLTKTAGSFRIDHPLDPANRYLSHSFVESPDMLNVYSGTATTDSKGAATVELPRYFEALNRDVRYQLTVIGAEFAQAIVSSEVKAGRFSIRSDRPTVKVSWQVTGIRKDVYALEHPIVAEQPKADADRGKYVYPRGFGKPDAAQIGRLPHPARPKAP